MGAVNSRAQARIESNERMIFIKFFGLDEDGGGKLHKVKAGLRAEGQRNAGNCCRTFSLPCVVFGYDFSLRTPVSGAEEASDGFTEAAVEDFERGILAGIAVVSLQDEFEKVVPVFGEQ